MQKKIRNAQTRKIPYMLVVGDKEAQDNTVSVRLRNGTDLKAMSLDSLLERILTEVKQRRDS
jgi:threonyl-tRNA synthetase